MSEHSASPRPSLPFAAPSYDGAGIVNLMASLITACGGRSGYATLAGHDLGDVLERARHIVLLVVDGLGYEHLQRTRAGTALRSRLRGKLSSVFPPTTATAVTTYLTGLAPSQHGLTGWHMYFREIGSIVAVLPFTTRFGAVPLAAHGVTAERLLGHEPVFDRMPRATSCVSPARIARSEFNLAHKGRAALFAYDSMHEFFASVVQIAEQGHAPGFTYAYWPELDRLAHEHGIGSIEVERHLAELDAGIDALMTQLAGTETVLIVTADHGFVDIEPERIVRMADHPTLAGMLRVPLCGEPRTAYCYVSPDRRRDFLDYVECELADTAHVVESRELVAGGAFGPEPVHAALHDRIGDFTLLMRDGYAIMQSLPGERPPALVGMHGGISSAELDVPLVVAAV